MQKPYGKLAGYAHGFIKDIIETFGPRYAGSEAEMKANKWIEDELAGFTDEVHLETYQVHPDLYPQGIIKMTGGCGLVAPIFMGFGVPWVIIAAACIFLGVFILFSELVMLKRWIKPFFKKATSSNVFGIINPSGKIKRTIVFEGHTDSAKQMRLAEYDKIPLKRFLLGVLYLPFIVVFSLLKFIGLLVPGGPIDTIARAGPLYWTAVDWIFLPLLPVLLYFFIFVIRGFMGDTVVPGASDNLSGSAVSAAVGKYFFEHRPRNVRLVIGSMGSEEIGDQGAKVFVARHGDLLENSYGYIIDDSGVGNKFHVIVEDKMHRAKYDPEVYERMLKAAERYRKEMPDAFPVEKKTIPLGSSDACMYVKAGYKASFIIGFHEVQGETEKLSKPPNWHSIRDTWQNIEKKMLRDGIGMAINFVEMVDEELD
ncbi:M28 family peptidase [Candidatus Bathyarchaeota archaeon]|nr:M28 family peptidase [Candidatus Bathyarchaeota archaeon]